MPPDHRLGAARVRAGLVPAAAADDPDGVLVPAHRPVPLRPLRRRHAVGDHRRGAARRQDDGRRDRAVAPGWAGCRRTRRSTATRSTSPTTRPRRASRSASYVVEQLKSGDLALRRRGPGRARTTTRGSCRSGGPTCSAPRARATSTSSSTCSAPTRSLRATETPPEAQRPSDVVWRDEAPEGKLDLLLTLDFRHDQHHDLLRRRAAGRHLVREARPQHHRHAPVRPLVQPRHRAAVADPHRLGRLADHRREVQRARRDPPRRAQGRRRGPADCTTPPTRWPTRTASSRDWKEGECEPVPGRDDAEARRGRARLRAPSRRR